MSKSLGVMFAVVMVAMLYFAAVSRISSSPTVEPETASVLEVEAVAPGIAETEQFASASCSHADLCIHYVYFVETEFMKEPSICAANKKHCGARSFMNDSNYGNVIRTVALVPTAGTALKLPSVIAVSDELDAHEAACSKLEVGAIGVRF